MAAIETFANVPSTTVSSGGTDAPAGGTSQSWTVASSTGFPAASTGVTQFHIGDPQADSEIITVTNISGTTWTVTRGAEGTTPIAHSAGFTVVQVVTAAFLGSVANFLRSPTIYAPGARTSLAITSTTMAAFAPGTVCTGSFIAPPSGSVLVHASFVAEVGTAASMAFGLAASGGVSPIVGNIWQFRDSAATAQARAYAIDFLVTGLTPGNAFNYDLHGAAASGVTVTILAESQTSTTPGLASGTDGGPVTMTVAPI